MKISAKKKMETIKHCFSLAVKFHTFHSIMGIINIGETNYGCGSNDISLVI